MTEDTPAKPERPWLTRLRGIGCVLIPVIAIAGIYNYAFDVPARISPETTYITEPLTADGSQVDYFAAAEAMKYPSGIATTKNGFRMIMEQLGPYAKDSPEEHRQICEKLGIELDQDPSLTFEDPHDVMKSYVNSTDAAGYLPADTTHEEFERDMLDRLSQPWTIDDLPMMATWIAENGTALDLVAEAARQPEFCIPYSLPAEDAALLEIELNEFQRLRRFARGFSARANYRIARGDIDGAIDDMLACLRLARHIQRGTAIESLVSQALEREAVSIGVAASLDHQPTVEQLQRLLDEASRLPARTAIADTLAFERLVLLDVIQGAAIGRSDEHSEISKALLNRDYGLDWNEVMRRANQDFETVILGQPVVRPDPFELQQIFSRTYRSQVMADLIVSLFSRSLLRFQEARHQTECRQNLSRIVIAMLSYERRHGTLPPAYTVDDRGNPLHSWRVLLLPELGATELYGQIRLDEPWDSPHNQQFHSANVPVYQCPSGDGHPGETTYCVVVGENCAFSGSTPRRLDEFGEHSANLILVVERPDAACWMDPTQEVPVANALRGINSNQVGPRLGSEHPVGMNVGFRSGTVKFVIENIDTTEFLPALLDGTSARSP